MKFDNRKEIKGIFSKEKMEDINCPLCESEKKTKIFPQTYPRLMKCLDCSLVYTSPRPKSSFIKQLYTENYFNSKDSSLFGYQNYLGDEIKIKKTFEKRMNQLQKFVNFGSLLDLGCATGFFLDIARKRGWKTEGVEISQFAANFAKEKLGLNVKTTDLQEMTWSANKYDVVTAWDVIEHLANPIKIFKNINKTLKKGGVFVFSTPDIGSLPAKITADRWIGYKLSDEHLTYFSKKTASLLCQKTGFKIIKSHYLGKYVSLSLFADRLGLYSRFLGKIAQPICRLFPENFNFYLSPFDIVCVYAQKV